MFRPLYFRHQYGMLCIVWFVMIIVIRIQYGPDVLVIIYYSVWSIVFVSVHVHLLVLFFYFTSFLLQKYLFRGNSY